VFVSSKDFVFLAAQPDLAITAPKLGTNQQLLEADERRFQGQLLQGNFLLELGRGQLTLLYRLCCGLHVCFLQRFCISSYAGLYCNHLAKLSGHAGEFNLIEMKGLRAMRRLTARLVAASGVDFSHQRLFIQQSASLSGSQGVKTFQRVPDLKGTRAYCSDLLPGEPSWQLNEGPRSKSRLFQGECCLENTPRLKRTHPN
jgi:hypothetical protein